MTHKSADPQRTILFPGSFDPFTIGHKSLVDRVNPLFDRIIIAVGENSGKASATPTAARIEAIKAVYASNPKVEVISYSGLTVDACRREGAAWMLRGVRSTADFEYERNLADINRNISGIETLLLYTLPEYSFISSSMVRELAANGYDVSGFLPAVSTTNS